MKMLLIIGLATFFPFSLSGNTKVIEVDFLKYYHLDYNGAGPLLVKSDSQRNRIILVNTYTSSISVIDGKNNTVENIPIQNRIPQHLKDAALAINSETGNIYVIGNKSIHVVFPAEKRSSSFETKMQYEMVAVDENTGNAFLVGRESKYIGMLELKEKKINYIKSFDREESLINLNATPPPAIRKVVCDAKLGKVFVTDGYTNSLYVFSTKTAKLLSKRILNLQVGERWHFAGYNQDSHALYMVIETEQRKVIQAARIDVLGEEDIVIDLPQYTEGVGINYNAKRDEVYVPYDNHASVHVVDFKKGGVVSEIKIPAYGNDASAIDEENDLLYIASWAYGEIDVIDLKERKLINRIKDVAILSHMFSLTLNSATHKLYIPLGATAVNGSHGAALTAFDTADFYKTKIHTGWAPVDLIQIPKSESFLVFSSEDEFAEVDPNGKVKLHKLPFDYPRSVISARNDNLYLSYGPHQSYWPTVYIWAAKNGIMEIEPKPLDISGNGSMNFQIYDIRIPRLAQQIVLENQGGLYALQNNWGKEKQFLSYFANGIRMFAVQERIEFDEEVVRETTQRY